MRAIQLGIEYDPAPPFDAGSPKKAPAEIVGLVRGLMEEKRVRYAADGGPAVTAASARR